MLSGISRHQMVANWNHVWNLIIVIIVTWKKQPEYITLLYIITKANNITASNMLALQCILKSWFLTIDLRSDSHTSIYYSRLFSTCVGVSVIDCDTNINQRMENRSGGHTERQTEKRSVFLSTATSEENSMESLSHAQKRPLPLVSTSHVRWILFGVGHYSASGGRI